MLARRLCDREEEQVIEADRMAEAARCAEPNLDGAETSDPEDITLGEALQSGPALTSLVLGDDSFIEAVKDGYMSDSMYSKILNKREQYKTFRVDGGIIYTKNRLGVEVMCIPRAQLKGKRSLPEVVIDHAHDTLGHLGAQKTSEYTRRWFWWPRMGLDVDRFCMSCATCQVSKTSNQMKVGLLHNMLIPTRPWQSVGMDFVGPFLGDQGLDYMGVVLCRLTSLVHLIPLSVRVKTTKLAWYYVRDIVRLHSMPDTIVSDRDTKFMAKFWKELHCVMGTKLLMSTLFHPQTNGQPGRAIRSISQVLRSCVSPDQKDWVSKLPLVEFALNSSINSSTGFAPFELTYGYMPRF